MSQVGSKSEVSRIREYIANEYIAARLGLSGLACGTSQHHIITARQERMGVLHEELHDLIGDKSVGVLVDTLNNLPEQPTRYYVEEALRYALGNTEETDILLDHLQKAWETFDVLVDRFSVESARKILNASSSLAEMPASS